jgi:hypothetical protein
MAREYSTPRWIISSSRSRRMLKARLETALAAAMVSSATISRREREEHSLAHGFLPFWVLRDCFYCSSHKSSEAVLQSKLHRAGAVRVDRMQERTTSQAVDIHDVAAAEVGRPTGSGVARGSIGR